MLEDAIMAARNDAIQDFELPDSYKNDAKHLVDGTHTRQVTSLLRKAEDIPKRLGNSDKTSEDLTEVEEKIAKVVSDRDEHAKAINFNIENMKFRAAKQCLMLAKKLATSNKNKNKELSSIDPAQSFLLS
jgi:hypothetical protein